MTLPPEEIADGYRMLDADEIIPGLGVYLHEIEVLGYDNAWQAGAYGAANLVIYRTKLSKPALRQARGLPPETTGLTVKEIAREAAFKMLCAIPYLGVIERDRSIIPLISDAINRALAQQSAELEAAQKECVRVGKERDEYDRQVTLSRNNWQTDSEEKDNRYYKMLSERDTLRTENARLQSELAALREENKRLVRELAEMKLFLTPLTKETHP